MSEACLLSLLCNTFHRNEQADKDVEGQGQAAQVHHHLLLPHGGHVNLSYSLYQHYSLQTSIYSVLID